MRARVNQPVHVDVEVVKLQAVRIWLGQVDRHLPNTLIGHSSAPVIHLLVSVTSTNRNTTDDEGSLLDHIEDDARILFAEPSIERGDSHGRCEGPAPPSAWEVKTASGGQAASQPACSVGRHGQSSALHNVAMANPLPTSAPPVEALGALVGPLPPDQVSALDLLSTDSDSHCHFPLSRRQHS